MAKPRRQKNGDQQNPPPGLSEGKTDRDLVGGTVLHQKLCLSIDMQRKMIYGHTELNISPPESGIIGLHAHNMTIGNVLLDGNPTEFEYFEHYQHTDDEKWNSVSSLNSAADAACSSYMSSLDRELVPNLLISCCEKDKSKDDLECSLRCGKDTCKSPGDLNNVLNGNDDHVTQQNIKVLHIDYCLKRSGTGIHFGETVLCADNQIGRAHCWFPCMNNNFQRCSYDLEFTVDLNFVAVSNGNLLYQILNNDDPPRKTYVYELRTPVSAPWISLTVAPFKVSLDPHNDLLSYMCLPVNLSMLQNTVGFFHNVFSHYEDYLYTSFPFGSYKQVFVPPDLLASSVNVGASICIFSSEVLFDEKIIIETINTRIKLAYALARQWFGGYIIAETVSDEWLLDGLAGFLTDSFIRRFLGNNEARYRRHKANCAVCQVDVSGATALGSAAVSKELYGTQSIGLYGKIRSWKAVAVLEMLEKQMGPESFRKILQSIVSQAKGQDSFRMLSTKEFRRLANKIGNLERPFLKEFFPRWVGSFGCPVLRLGLSYMKRKNTIELAVLRTSTPTTVPESVNPDNENRDSDMSWPGMMSVRVHELDGMYDHPSLPLSGESLQLLEIQLHSKLASKRFQKTKKGSKLDGSDDNGDTVSFLDTRSMDSPLLWIRVDPEMEYLAEVHFHQPVLMWINQLEKDKDVIAQSEAITALRTLPRLSVSDINVLESFLRDPKAFWRVRIEAAFTLAHASSEESDLGGLLCLLKFYQSRRYEKDIGLPKPNNFHDIPEYFVLQAIPLAVAMVRSSDKKSPREAVEFILQLLKYNDNNGNPYSDVHWLATLVRSIGELELGKQHTPFLSSLLKRVDRLLQIDRLMPSYNGILTINCIRTLAQIGLKMLVPIPIVFGLIKSFRNFNKWKIRLEANKSLISLELYSKGLDAALSMFVELLEEESCFRGQVKLAIHTLRLCEANNDSESTNCIRNATLVSLLRLLAGIKAFNNIFLRHHLFCILQIIAGRPPTLYGVQGVALHSIADGAAFEELKLKSSLLRMRLSESQESNVERIADTTTSGPDVLPTQTSKVLLPTVEVANDVTVAEETAKNVVPTLDVVQDVPHAAEAAENVLPTVDARVEVIPRTEAPKNADTLSNSYERRVLKIRVKKPAASNKPESNGNMVETSRGWRDETDVGPTSSVSVDAPLRVVANETVSSSCQVPEEVNSLCIHGSNTTASVGSAKVVTNDDVVKELQCTADSSNIIPEDRSSPTLKRSDGEDDTQKSSCLPEHSFQRHDEVKPSASVDGREPRGKEKKHREKKRKREGKEEDKDRRDDPEYTERKRLKKEKRRMEKELAKSRGKEAMTESAEPPIMQQSSERATDSKGFPSLKKAEGSSEASGGQENKTHNLGTRQPPTKVRIKIKSRSTPNS